RAVRALRATTTADHIGSVEPLAMNCATSSVMFSSAGIVGLLRCVDEDVEELRVQRPGLLHVVGELVDEAVAGRARADLRARAEGGAVALSHRPAPARSGARRRGCH